MNICGRFKPAKYCKENKLKSPGKVQIHLKACERTVCQICIKKVRLLVVR
jgi:hypothetical protein